RVRALARGRRAARTTRFFVSDGASAPAPCVSFLALGSSRMAKQQARSDHLTRGLALCGCALACGFTFAVRAQQPPPELAPITPPVVLERVDAEYPPALLAERREATVVLLVTVAADGSVGDVSVAESGGDAFDASAVDAIKRWRFTPAHHGE